MIEGVDTYDLLGGLTSKPILKVIVKFEGGEPPSEVQGPALLHFEAELRQLSGLDIRVFKERMGDDSKLRIMMTPTQREAL
jgi:hypothetical protein